MRQPGGISGALGAIRSLPIRSGTVNNHSVPWPSGAGKAGEKLKNQAPKRPQAVHRHPDTLAKARASFGILHGVSMVMLLFVLVLGLTVAWIAGRDAVTASGLLRRLL